jgi:hypothetical protein
LGSRESLVWWHKARQVQEVLPPLRVLGALRGQAPLLASLRQPTLLP